MTDAELLVKVEAALSGTLDRNAQQLSINGRSITSLSIKELIDLRATLLRNIANSSRTGSAVVVTFRNAGN